LLSEGNPTACGYLNLLQNNIIPEITALFPRGNKPEIPAP
jgi:hypothetical protein